MIKFKGRENDNLQGLHGILDECISATMYEARIAKPKDRVAAYHTIALLAEQKVALAQLGVWPKESIPR